MSRIAVRRAHADDQKAVTALITSAGGTQKMKKRWGQFNLAALIEFGYLSVVAYEASDAEEARSDAKRNDQRVYVYVCMFRNPHRAGHAERERN